MKTNPWIVAAGIVIGFGVWFVVRTQMAPFVCVSKHAAAESEAREWSSAVERFLSIHRRLPASLAELTQPDPELGDEPYADVEPIDPWGRDFVFATIDATHWLIVSFGSDGKARGVNDAADIVRGSAPRER